MAVKDSPQWKRLSFVSCACNGLLLMDESLQLLPAVETLDLSRNKFSKVDNLRKCTKLKHLDLGFNHLRALSSFSGVKIIRTFPYWLAHSCDLIAWICIDWLEITFLSVERPYPYISY